MRKGLIICLGCSLLAVSTIAKATSDDPVLQAAVNQVERALQELKVASLPPYFIAVEINDSHGVDIQAVKEVIKHREITRLPKAPAFVKGEINLRGDVIPSWTRAKGSTWSSRSTPA